MSSNISASAKTLAAVQYYTRRLGVEEIKPYVTVPTMLASAINKFADQEGWNDTGYYAHTDGLHQKISNAFSGSNA